MMKTYEFALVINREPTDIELLTVAEDELHDAGIAAFETNDGHVLAHAAVDAESLAAAITHAMHGIEALGQLGLQVLGIGSDDLVSLRDIPERTGRTYESVRLLAAGQRGPGSFPSSFSSGQWALYSWAEVSAWFAAHYRSDALGAFDREIAAADLLIRARRILGDDDNRDEMTRLVSA